MKVGGDAGEKRNSVAVLPWPVFCEESSSKGSSFSHKNVHETGATSRNDDGFHPHKFTESWTSWSKQ